MASAGCTRPLEFCKMHMLTTGILQQGSNSRLPAWVPFCTQERGKYTQAFGHPKAAKNRALWRRQFHGLQLHHAIAMSSGYRTGVRLPQSAAGWIVARKEQEEGAENGQDKTRRRGRPRTRRVVSIPSLLYRPLQFPDLAGVANQMTPLQRKLAGAMFLGALAGVAWFRNLGAAGLVDDTEPLFVEAARQMIVTGDYITPQFNAQPRFDKPVLIYWLMAMSGKILGPEVWAFRLPSALCAVGLLLGLLVTVRRFSLQLAPKALDEENDTCLASYLPAIIAAAAFALNLEVLAWGSTALSDMLLTGTIAGALLTFFWGYVGFTESPRKYKWGYFLSALFMGLACLAKGPVGIAFPVLVCTAFLICIGDLKQVLMRELPWVEGTLTLLVMNLPWYLTMLYRHGLMYISTFFGYHNIERFMKGVNHHGGRPWWYGLAVVFLMYLPWSVSLPPALAEINPWGRRLQWQEVSRARRLTLFSAIWLIVGFSLFALSSTQLPSYYLPIAPAVALLAAAHLSKKPDENGDLAKGLAPSIVYQLVAGAVWFSPALLQASGDKQAALIGLLVGEKHLHELGLLIFAIAGTFATRTSEFATIYMPKFRGKSSETPQAVPVDTRKLLPLWVLHTITMLIFLGAFVHPVYKVVDEVRQQPLRNLATTAAKLQQAGEPLVMVGTRMPSVVFYSKLPTAFFDNISEALRVLHEAAPLVSSALIMSEEKLEDILNTTVLDTAGTYNLVRIDLQDNHSILNDEVAK